jgi:L-ribulose-5-phosphate 4-epimerase
VYHAAVLEEVCKMALLTVTLDPQAAPLPEHIIRKHWERKHGPDAYYGQR